VIEGKQSCSLTRALSPVGLERLAACIAKDSLWPIGSATGITEKGGRNCHACCSDYPFLFQ